MPGAMATKNTIAAAMERLMRERPFSKISIVDVCAACGMSRKSFYYHFRDKYDLVNWIFRTAFDRIIAELETPDVWTFLLALCRYFSGNRAFYVNAFAFEGQNSFSEYFEETMQPAAKLQLMALLPEDEEQEFYAAFLTDAVRVSIVRWLRDYPGVSPEAYVGRLRTAIIGAAHTISEQYPPEAGAAPRT